MKLRRIFAAAMLICLSICLIGCSSNLIASWKLTGGSAISAIHSLAGNSSLDDASAEVVFTFADNGALELKIARGDEQQTIRGTWSEDDDTVVLTISENSVKCSYAINKNELTLFFTLEGQNATFVLSKM